ncbi:GumC family protein [Methylobacterium sp. WSM2598]|uniref:GumC family protein n=1 Tax=Methylobacterium sp. WSM2598 TaxID=398261 RepID=UPI00037F2371|nr:polysaccharide biosynthesis tyrosine autokinase [Methylobacterium sp. WSM2598]
MSIVLTKPDVGIPPRPAPRIGVATRLWRRRGLFLTVFSAVLGAAVAALLVIPVRYVASGSVIVAEPEPGTAANSAAWAQKVGDPADLESQLLVVRSPRILRLAMTQPGVAEAARRECRTEARGGPLGLARVTGEPAAACDALAPGSDALFDYLDRRVMVGNVGRSRVITVAFQAQLPDVAQGLTNAVITAFLDDQRSGLAKSREAAASWIWQEIRQLDQSLREEEEQIQAYRRRRGLVRGATAPIASEKLTSISQQLASAETARADAAARLREISADQARGSADSPAVLASRTIGDLKQQYAQLSAQLANAETTLGPNHPTIQGLRRERDQVQARMKREVASVAASARQVYEASNGLVASLKRQLDAAKDEVGAAADAEAAIAAMVRSVELKRGQYTDLYKRASELETERRILTGSTRLVSLAELPTRPFFPKRLPFLAAGLTLATLLGAAAALLRDRTDGTVRAAHAIDEVAGTTTLAQLPRLSAPRPFPGAELIPGRRTLPLGPALSGAARDPKLQAALRQLAAQLALRPPGRTPRSLLVTSASPQEGKTFTTLALAARLAASGQRVLVIEADLRAPSIEAGLDLPPSPGLGAVLRGEAPARAAIVRSRLPGVDVLPAGGPVEDSTELLAGPRVAGVLALAEEYDLALVDSPPLGALMDATLLARRVEAVLVCARWGWSQVEEAAAAVAGVRAAGGTVAGTVITLVRPQDQALYGERPGPARASLGAA